MPQLCWLVSSWILTSYELHRVTQGETMLVTIAARSLDSHYLYLGLFFLVCIVQHETNDHWLTQQTGFSRAFEHYLLQLGCSWQWWRMCLLIFRCWLQLAQDSVVTRSDAFRLLHQLRLCLQDGGCGSCTHDVRGWHFTRRLRVTAHTPWPSTQGGAVAVPLQQLVPFGLPAATFSAGEHRKPDGWQSLHGWTSLLSGWQKNDLSRGSWSSALVERALGDGWTVKSLWLSQSPIRCAEVKFVLRLLKLSTGS